MRKIVIATRGSQLALWQANHIREALLSLEPDIEVELSVIRTRGDKILDVPLSKVGGKGLFVKEIEEALLDCSADLAVHSIKDVPMVLPEKLTLGCIPRREVFTDCLVSEKYATLDDLPHGARVGTSSLRMDTRLRKMKEGEFDAIVLASAGMKRLGLSATYMHELDPAGFVPAVGQGALGIECRVDDAKILALLARLDHAETRVCVEAERAFLTGLDGGCQVPIGAHADVLDGMVRLDGLVAECDGSQVFRRAVMGPATEAARLGRDLASDLKQEGAGDILARLYAEHPDEG